MLIAGKSEVSSLAFAVSQKNIKLSYHLYYSKLTNSIHFKAIFSSSTMLMMNNPYHPMNCNVTTSLHISTTYIISTFLVFFLVCFQLSYYSIKIDITHCYLSTLECIIATFLIKHPTLQILFLCEDSKHFRQTYYRLKLSLKTKSKCFFMLHHFLLYTVIQL